MTDFMSLVVSALTDACTEKTPKDILTKLQNREDVLLEDLLLDSLSRFEVMMKIEDTLDIELDEDDLIDQKSVQGLANYLASRT